MTREEAIDILEEVKELDDSIYQYNTKYLKALDMAIQALEQAQWIPVGKKSPVAFEKVLVTYRLHYDDSIHIGIGNTTSNVNGRYYWCLDEQDYKTWDILAWMPLPESYKGE